jgi:ubiquinone/menaquinone biosynthesis C-methylase UbiE
MTKDRNPGRMRAEEFDEIARTIFFPIYPVLAHQILKETDTGTGTCLDVGSGPGHLAIAVATLSDLFVYALDSDEQMCRIAGNNVKKYGLERRVRQIHGDVRSLPFNDKSMDLVVSRGSFFFWDDLTRGFSECSRVLKPGGWAYIGGGFGNARLRDEIFQMMRERDPSWEEKRCDWYNTCNPRIVRAALAAARITQYEVTEDDRGYWVRFRRGK